MSDVLLYEAEDGVAVLTLNRPERRNAVDVELGEALNGALVRAATDKSVRVLIITGAGESFCAGGDAVRLQENAAGGPTSSVIRALDPNPIFDAVPDTPPEHRSRYTFAAAMPIPVIAAVNGAAAGAGLALALSADIRIAAPKAAFIASFARIGGAPEMGLAWTLPRLIGVGPATDMLLTGRRVEAEEALRLGLVTRIAGEDALMDEVMALARDLAERCSPRTMRLTKQMLRAAQTQTFAEAFEVARHEAIEAFASADFREGVLALKERRAPNFKRE
jgi:enoyl-CoA hydratase/carnithine racemase